MKPFIKVMKALSDPNRVKIIKMLQHKSMCVCEIKEALHVSQPSVSKNLKILENAGLVESNKDGLWANYSLSDGGKSPYVASLLGNLRHWLEDEKEVEELIRRLPMIRREGICKK
jgi:ArsR family transcriptional regulator, arsenate/arsenite/antimonite-responsive transcriptional repressor